MTLTKCLKYTKYINVTILVTIDTKMITILKPGYSKIMALFYTDKSVKLHLREIARKASLHEPSTTRFLHALEKEGILKSEKDGNQKKYSIKNNYKTFAVFQLFDLERLAGLPSIRKSAIKYYLEALQEKPIIALIFGSTSKGTFKEDSDIDILLITNSKADTKEAERNAEALAGIKISTFQIPLKTFLKELKLREEPVIQAALTTGYPITNHIYFYEELLHEHQVFA